MIGGVLDEPFAWNCSYNYRMLFCTIAVLLRSDSKANRWINRELVEKLIQFLTKSMDLLALWATFLYHIG